MKSLILKDIYNISHNAKQLLFTIIFIAICMIPSTGASGFGVTVTMICSMMTMTTFSMDERSNWMKYALIMPVTRKDYVKSKYVVNLIFTLFGMIIGALIGTVGLMVKGSGNLADNLQTTLACCIVGVMIGIFYGGVFIPLLFKWGAEKARMISVVAVAIPSFIAFGLYKLAIYLGIKLAGANVVIGIIAIIMMLIAMNIISFRLSVKWLKEKEF